MNGFYCSLCGEFVEIGLFPSEDQVKNKVKRYCKKNDKYVIMKKVNMNFVKQEEK